MVSRVPAMSSGRLMAAAGPERRGAAGRRCPAGPESRAMACLRMIWPRSTAAVSAFAARVAAGSPSPVALAQSARRSSRSWSTVPVTTGWMAASQAAPGPAGLPAPSRVSWSRVMFSSRRTGWPARSGRQPAASSRVHASSRASCCRWAWVRVSSGPRRGDSESEDGVDGGGAPGGQVAVEPAGAAEGGGEPDAAVGEPVAGVGVGGGVLAAQLVEDGEQVGQGRAAAGGGEEQPCRRRAGSRPGAGRTSR